MTPQEIRQLHKQGDYEAALYEWKSILGNDPHCVDALRGAILCSRRLAQLPQAAKFARDLYQHPNASLQDWQLRFDLLRKLGKAHVVERFATNLSNLRCSESHARADTAEKLCAAKFYTHALRCLDGNRESIGDQERCDALRLIARVELGHLREASAIVVSHPEIATRVPEQSARKLEQLLAYVQNAEIKLPPEENIAKNIVDHWLLRLESLPGRERHDFKRKRVVLSVSSLGVGGSERQALAIAEGLSRDEDLDIRILVHDKRDLSYEAAVDERIGLHWGDAHYPPPLLGKECHRLLEEMTTIGPLIGFSRLAKCASIIHYLRPEVVHIRGGFNAEMLIGSLIAGVKRIVCQFGSMPRTEQSDGTDSFRRRTETVEHVCMRLAARSEVVFAANSKAAIRAWGTAVQIPPEKQTVLYNGLTESQSRLFRVASEINADETTIGGVFRLEVVKDPLLWVDVAYDVAQKLPNARFLVIGDGPLREQMINKIVNLGLRDRFNLPGIVLDGLEALYRQMDVFLLTSQTESLSNAVIEAQIAGLPVVAPCVGGLPEAVASRSTAKLCDRTVPALSAAILKAVEDREWRANVASVAPERILSRFSQINLVTAVRTVYGFPAQSDEMGVVSAQRDRDL